jgi:hypothetical protein
MAVPKFGVVDEMGRLACDGQRRRFGRTYTWGSGWVVHAAAKKFVLCADDDSLSERSFADDVSVWDEHLPM